MHYTITLIWQSSILLLCYPALVSVLLTVNAFAYLSSVTSSQTDLQIQNKIWILLSNPEEVVFEHERVEVGGGGRVRVSA